MQVDVNSASQYNTKAFQILKDITDSELDFGQGSEPWKMDIENNQEAKLESYFNSVYGREVRVLLNQFKQDDADFEKLGFPSIFYLYTLAICFYKVKKIRYASKIFKLLQLLHPNELVSHNLFALSLDGHLKQRTQILSSYYSFENPTVLKAITTLDLAACLASNGKIKESLSIHNSINNFTTTTECLPVASILSLAYLYFLTKDYLMSGHFFYLLSRFCFENELNLKKSKKMKEMQIAFNFGGSQFNFIDKSNSDLSALRIKLLTIAILIREKKENAIDLCFELANLLVDAGRYEEAKKFFNKGSLNNELKPEWILGMGKCYELSGDTKSAESIYLSLMAKLPLFEETYIYISEMVKKVDLSNSICFLRQIVDKVNSFSECKFHLASLLIERGDQNEALAILAELSTSSNIPQTLIIKAHLKLAYLGFISKSFLLCIEHIFKTLEMDKNNCVAIAYLAEIHLYYSSFSYAMSLFGNLKSFLGNFCYVSFKIGICLLRAKRYPEACMIFCEVLNLDCEFRENYLMLTEALFMTNSYKDLEGSGKNLLIIIRDYLQSKHRFRVDILSNVSRLFSEYILLRMRANSVQLREVRDYFLICRNEVSLKCDNEIEFQRDMLYGYINNISFEEEKFHKELYDCIKNLQKCEAKKIFRLHKPVQKNQSQVIGILINSINSIYQLLFLYGLIESMINRGCPLQVIVYDPSQNAINYSSSILKKLDDHFLFLPSGTEILSNCDICEAKAQILSSQNFSCIIYFEIFSDFDDSFNLIKSLSLGPCARQYVVTNLANKKSHIPLTKNIDMVQTGSDSDYVGLGITREKYHLFLSSGFKNELLQQTTEAIHGKFVIACMMPTILISSQIIRFFTLLLKQHLDFIIILQFMSEQITSNILEYMRSILESSFFESQSDQSFADINCILSRFHFLPEGNFLYLLYSKRINLYLELVDKHWSCYFNDCIKARTKFLLIPNNYEMVLYSQNNESKSSNIKRSIGKAKKAEKDKTTNLKETEENLTRQCLDLELYGELPFSFQALHLLRLPSFTHFIPTDLTITKEDYTSFINVRTKKCTNSTNDTKEDSEDKRNTCNKLICGYCEECLAYEQYQSDKPSYFSIMTKALIKRVYNIYKNEPHLTNSYEVERPFNESVINSLKEQLENFIRKLGEPSNNSNLI